MSINLNILPVASEHLKNQLLCYLTPLIFEGLISIYEEAKDKEKARPDFYGNYIKQFQMFLKMVPSWNQNTIDDETKRILDRVDFIMELVTLIFLSNVKILACVKMGSQNNNIKIRIPTSDVFIHKVYCEAAKSIYYKPQPFRNYKNIENMEIIEAMIDKSILETIEMMIPVGNILKEYLNKIIESGGNNGESQTIHESIKSGDGIIDNFNTTSVTSPTNDFTPPPQNDTFFDDSASVASEDTFISDDVKPQETPSDDFLTPTDFPLEEVKPPSDMFDSSPIDFKETPSTTPIDDIFNQPSTSIDSPPVTENSNIFGVETNISAPVDDSFGKEAQVEQSSVDNILKDINFLN